jgi:hypothetical protein
MIPSQAFSTLSWGAYSGPTTQVDRDQETLVAVAADGSSKIASELSKHSITALSGLWIAGYYEFAKTPHPVPFVANDIMETFDDFRAEEAFGRHGAARAGDLSYRSQPSLRYRTARSPDIRITTCRGKPRTRLRTEPSCSCSRNAGSAPYSRPV